MVPDSLVKYVQYQINRPGKSLAGAACLMLDASPECQGRMLYMPCGEKYSPYKKRKNI